MDSVLKLVYSHWYKENEYKYPLANGNSSEFYEYIKSIKLNSKNKNELIDELNSKLHKHYFQFNELTQPISYFINSNFHLHCEQQGIEIVSEDEIDDVGTYLYPIEPMCGTILRIPTDDFLRSLSPKLINCFKTKKVKLLLVNMVDPAEHRDILIEIANFFSKHGITDIISLQGNINYDNKTFIKQIESITSLYDIARDIDFYPCETALGYVSDYVREIKNIVRPKKFLSFNRFMRNHRVGLAHIVLKHNLLESGYFSFLIKENKDQSRRKLQSIGIHDNDTIDSIDKLIPCQLDTHHLSNSELISFFTVTNNLKTFYDNSYIHIVTETQFDQNASPFFSEKTWRPILNLQPFIYIGLPLSLNKLQMLGFKTFHPFIDESYDLEKDSKIRFFMIEKEILKLHKMSIEQIHNWYLSISDILLHNQQHLHSFKNYNPLYSLMNLK